MRWLFFLRRYAHALRKFQSTISPLPGKSASMPVIQAVHACAGRCTMTTVSDPAVSDRILASLNVNDAGDTEMPATAWPFISTDDAGFAVIEGTRTKVIEVALDRFAHEWSADDICRQHSNLTLPQVHAALGYYFEHREECDRQIEEGLSRAEEICKRHENAALIARLRSGQGP